ncbi:MAG TPA: DUF2249 domain-containing protein [Stellaceae bacterium]|nr:DUF2249 domain-containing protein [Stellaceae bacterium]
MNTPSPLTVDVRPILRAGGEPFAEIMTAVASLVPGQALRLLATFKPIPLFAVMAGRGFDHTERPIGGGEWEVLFTPAAAAAAKPAATAAAPTATLDTRGLEPPEPMVRVLAALESMAPGSTLEAYTAREPVFLYRALAERGIAIGSEALGEAGYRHIIQVPGRTGEAA